jgi:hypothetical protein
VSLGNLRSGPCGALVLEGVGAHGRGGLTQMTPSNGRAGSRLDLLLNKCRKILEDGSGAKGPLCMCLIGATDAARGLYIVVAVLELLCLSYTFGDGLVAVVGWFGWFAVVW